MPTARMVNDNIPTTADVDVDGVVTGAKQGAKGILAVSTAAVETKTSLAKTLTDIVRELDAVRQRVDSNPAQQPMTFWDVPVTNGGIITLTHGLGRRVRWRIVDWVPSSAGTQYNLERREADTTTEELVLNSYADGDASIEVY